MFQTVRLTYFCQTHTGFIFFFSNVMLAVPVNNTDLLQYSMLPVGSWYVFGGTENRPLIKCQHPLCELHMKTPETHSYWDNPEVKNGAHRGQNGPRSESRDSFIIRQINKSWQPPRRATRLLSRKIKPTQQGRESLFRNDSPAHRSLTITPAGLCRSAAGSVQNNRESFGDI